MKRIKKLWPEHALVLVCRRGVGDFFAKAGLVDEVIEIKKGDADSYAAAVKKLETKDIDKLISAHESLRTAFFVRSLRAQTKIGFHKWWNGLFYAVREKKPMPLPDSMRQLSLLRGYDAELAAKMADYAAKENPYAKDARGLLPAPPTWASMGLRGLYQDLSQGADGVLAKLGLTPEIAAKSIALFPGSVWATKRWTKRGFIELGQQLRSEGIEVLVMGGPGEEVLCAEVTSQISGARDLCGRTTIFESALVLSKVAAVVGNDSASLHLAATAETPSVAVFGPTVLKFGFRPWQGRVAIAEIENLKCRPCGKHGHQKCPLGHHNCMEQLSKESVRALLQNVLHADAAILP